MENKKREILCPTCKKKTEFSSDNPYRPFCSDRCRLIDLGAWASESYKVPSAENENWQDIEDNRTNEDDENNY